MGRIEKKGAVAAHQPVALQGVFQRAHGASKGQIPDLSIVQVHYMHVVFLGLYIKDRL